jgi:hypothetical protein
VLKAGLKRRPPRPVAMHRIWGLDLTGKTDCQGDTHTLLGIVEHASRANLALSALQDKAVLTPMALTYGKALGFRHSGVCRNPGIPHRSDFWIPACAGMTCF